MNAEQEQELKTEALWYHIKAIVFPTTKEKISMKSTLCHELRQSSAKFLKSIFFIIAKYM